MNINLNDFVKALYQQTNQKDMLISNGINYYLTDVKINKRPATYKYYVDKFKYIMEYFEMVNISYISQITTSSILKYINYLESKKLKNISINKFVGAIKTMIKYLEDNELIEPVNLKIKKLKEVQANIELIELEDIKKILKYLETKKIQYQLIFKLIISTGIRRTELINIKRKNIDFINNTIFLDHTKTGHTRFIYIDENIKELIKYEIKYKPSSNYLFVTHEGNQLTTSAIDSIFLRTKKELNLERLSPHKLRHTYATIIMEQQQDLEQVRLLLGHRTYDMTRRYLHIKNKKLMETSLNCNPLAVINRE